MWKALNEDWYDLIYRTVFTAVIALFIFFEIYNFVDPGVISGGNIFSLIMISLSYSALRLIYRKVRFYIFPALLAVGFLFWLTSDRGSLDEITGGVSFSLLLIGLAAFVIFMICDRVLMLGIAVSAGVFVFMLVEMFKGYEVYRASPALAAFYALSVLTRYLRNGLRAKEQARTRKYIAFLFPFLLSYMLLLAVWPKPEEPVSWNWVRKLYENASRKIDLLIHRLSSDYGVIDAGHFKISFGMDEKMNYDNSGDDDWIELFEVIPDGSISGSLYLKGEIFNEFSGGEWHNTLEDGEDYVAADSLETRLGAGRYKEVPGNYLVKDSTIRVKYRDILSPIIFTPAKTVSFSNISDKKKAQAVNEHLVFDGSASYGYEYAVSFLQINLGNTVFADYMNAPGVIAEGDGLDGYRDYIRRSYTSTPVVRDSVRKWIGTVTAEAGSDYERLLAVEQALSGFEYNINTKKMPDNVQSEGDFIDNFILEKREGYCVHYATAFCLIARYMGFPSRVVRGYKTEVSGNTPTIVRDECGHSWPEVYFEGKGWIPFEPTPGMGSARYGGWEVKTGKIRDKDSAGARTGNTAPLPEEDEEYADGKNGNVSWMLILVTAGVILFSVLLLLTVRIAMKRVELRKMDAQQRYYHEFDMLLRMLAELGIKRGADETFAEFAAGSGIQTFEKCAEIHEGCIYGGRTPTEENTAVLAGCRKELELLMKEKFGRTYFLHWLKLII